MPSIQKSLHSYNVGWLKKLYYKQNEDLHWIHILKQDLNKYRKGFKLKWLFQLSIDEYKSISKSEKFNNPFWKAVLDSTAELLKSNNIGNNNSLINMKWDENPLLLEIGNNNWPPKSDGTNKNRLKRIRKEDYSRMSNIQTQHFFPKDAIIYNGTIDPESGRIVHEIPNRFMTYEEFKTRRIKERYRDEGYLKKEHYDKYIGMIKANLIHYGQDIRYVDEMKTSIIEDIFIKQGTQGCNRINKCFKNPNNYKIKIDRRQKEWEWENIFGRPIQISVDRPTPTWQKDRDTEWSIIHKSKKNIGFSNEDVWLLIKIIRRHLPTNKAVEDWKHDELKNTANYKCDICKLDGSIETIEHIYLECPRVVSFIVQIKQFFNKNISIFPGGDWKNEHYMFGTTNKEHSIFYMVLRSYIWFQCKKKCKEPDLLDFIGTLIDRTDKLCRVSTWKINDRPINKKTVEEYSRILEELKDFVNNKRDKMTFRVQDRII